MTEELEYVPPSHGLKTNRCRAAGRFIVNRIVRPRMACSGCDCFTQAPLPTCPIERGRPGPGLLAHVLPLDDALHRLPGNGSTNMPITCRFTAKARYSSAKASIRWPAGHVHMPERLDRSTLADWVGKSTALLEPLANAFHCP